MLVHLTFALLAGSVAVAQDATDSRPQQETQQTPQLTLERSVHPRKIGFRAAEVDASGRFLLAGTFDGYTYLWETATLKLVARTLGDLGGFT